MSWESQLKGTNKNFIFCNVKYKRFAKLLRIEFLSSVEFEDTKAFTISMGKNGSIAEEEMCCQMKSEKFLLIEIAEVQGVLTTVGVIKVNELVRSYKRQRSISE